MYPKIDISRYASEESRIKERAKAEELKQAEQRAYEDRQQKEQQAANEKPLLNKSRRKPQKLYNSLNEL